MAFLWACLSSAEVKRERRILPLDHHRRLKNHPHLDRSLRSNTNGGASAGYSSVDGNEATRSNGGSNIKNKQNSAGGYASATKQNSATDYTSTDGKKAAKTGREKRSGTGFLGDNLNNIYGWKSHGGSAYGSPVHSYNSAPSPASSWDGGHYKSGGNSPTVNSGYTPTHSYYPSGSSKSKGSHSGKSTGKGKSKSKGKAKGKKSKGKTGKSKSSQNEAARPIESDYGRDGKNMGICLISGGVEPYLFSQSNALLYLQRYSKVRTMLLLCLVMTPNPNHPKLHLQEDRL